MNNPNHSEKSLNDCNPQFPQNLPNEDQSPPMCGRKDNEINKRAINDENLNWLKENLETRDGLGAKNDCDPMKRGILRNTVDDPNVLYRYTQSIRGCTEAIQDMFSNIEVIDENGKAHGVPVISATQEKAVAIIMQDNVRKDNSTVVDRIKLPMLAISWTDTQIDMERNTYHQAIDFMRTRSNNFKPGFAIKEHYERDTVFGKSRGLPVNHSYTMTAWTLYLEDMHQILEQILLKFDPLAYIRVKGIDWEISVELESIANNIDTEPGDQAIRVVKFQFNILVKSYIPQPITRRKAVLKTTIDFVDGLTESEVNTITAKIEEKVKEFEC